METWNVSKMTVSPTAIRRLLPARMGNEWQLARARTAGHRHPRTHCHMKPARPHIHSCAPNLVHPMTTGDSQANGSPALAQVVSMYVDQQADTNPHDDTSETDIHRQRAEEFGFTLYDDIGEALRCGG